MRRQILWWAEWWNQCASRMRQGLKRLCRVQAERQAWISKLPSDKLMTSQYSLAEAMFLAEQEFCSARAEEELIVSHPHLNQMQNAWLMLQRWKGKWLAKALEDFGIIFTQMISSIVRSKRMAKTSRTEHEVKESMDRALWDSKIRLLKIQAPDTHWLCMVSNVRPKPI